jgi:hypothetical protein
MGCDIHLYVERRNGQGWESCDVWEKSEYEPHEMTVPYGKHFYSDRSYDTFSILANVRNGYGFAGTDTGEGFVPIAAPRGLPDDLSPQLAAEAAIFLEHTPSWLTAKELMDYDWTQITTKRGWLSGPQYADWIEYQRGEGEGPRAWCGGISGGGVEHISEDEMAKRVAAVQELFKGANYKDLQQALKGRLGSMYCQVSWQIPYYRAASGFLSRVMPRLWRLGKPEDVRIVFWFDS